MLDYVQRCGTKPTSISCVVWALLSCMFICTVIKHGRPQAPHAGQPFLYSKRWACLAAHKTAAVASDMMFMQQCHGRSGTATSGKRSRFSHLWLGSLAIHE